jgi:3-hydroxyacyl-CoA dehydrogenase/enoyl-CoA hydratase/3-hydroxybutyryl-CoA epimerase
MNAFSIDRQDGIARLVLDLPGEPVNKLSKTVRDELESILPELAKDSDVRAVVLLSGKPDNFIAGADIDEFVALESPEEALSLVQTGQELVNRFADIGKPVVAAIHGPCLGGGLETALACSYRVATNHPKTSLGLPEVQLGILPAAGGCQRLPRLIGVRAALGIILAGKTVPARRAHRMGIVDEVVHPAVLERVAMEQAGRLAGGWRPRRPKGGVAGLLLDRNPLGRRLVFSKAAKQLSKQTGGHYPAPVAALDAVRHGLSQGVKAGLAREAEHFAELAVGDVSRKLVQIFFATTALKKDAGVDGDVTAPKPKKVENLGIVGSGFMGAGIGGTAVSRAHVDARFRDTTLEGIGAGLQAARKILKSGLRRRRITKYEFRRLDSLISGGVDWSGFGRANLVVEAVFEDLEIKHQVFSDLEAHVREDCVLASNTSTIPIAKIAEVVEHRERVIGMHFFSPVEKMPLLEVIVTNETAPWATVTALTFGRKMGKTVIVTRDCPGFWVNRILSPYLNEAGRLIHEGVPIEEIDGVMKRFGFPVGPITLLDEVGLDVAQKASSVMHRAYGDRMSPIEGLKGMIDDGRRGRKSGKGFYRYEKGKKQGVDQTVYEIFNVEPSPVPETHVEQRLVLAMLNEAARAVDEKVVRSPRDGDIGAIFGIGFPPFRGGPLRHLDDIGAVRAVDTLEILAGAYGQRFSPAASLKRMAVQGESFYPRA